MSLATARHTRIGTPTAFYQPHSPFKGPSLLLTTFFFIQTVISSSAVRPEEALYHQFHKAQNLQEEETPFPSQQAEQKDSGQ